MHFPVPEAPWNLTISEVTTSSFFVTWESPLCMYGALKYYIVKIEYIGDCSTEEKSFPYIIQSNETHVTFNSAMPYSDYNVIVLAETETGKGASVNMTVTTQEDGNIKFLDGKKYTSQFLSNKINK